ncbi:MAG: DUF397 domain-containing protein [Kibdelosporangium sp.]
MCMSRPRPKMPASSSWSTYPHKSGYSGAGSNADHVEVARTSQVAAVRDSKNPLTGVLSSPAGACSAFLEVGLD